MSSSNEAMTVIDKTVSEYRIDEQAITSQSCSALSYASNGEDGPISKKGMDAPTLITRREDEKRRT